MRSSPCLLLAAVSSIVMLACSDTSAPRSPVSDAPGYSFTNGPVSPGPVVFRIPDDFLIAFIPDERDNLTAYLGVEEPVSSLCDITQPITIEPLDAQILEKPNGIIGWLSKGEVPIYIYDVVTFDFCGGALSDDHILAVGTARVVFNDHDLDPADPNLDPSYGYRVNGTVTLVTGGTAHVSGVVKWVTTGSGQVKVHSQVTLARKP